MSMEFTPDEVSIIENMMLTAPHKKIARMIDKPEPDVAKLVEAMCASRGLESYQVRKNIPFFTTKTRKKKPEKEPDISLRLRAMQREQEDKQRRDMEMQRKAKKIQREEESKFKTRVVDYSKQHTVRLDSKTWIVVNPGESEKEAIARFCRNHPKYIKNDEDHSRSTAKAEEVNTCKRCKKDKLVSDFFRDDRNADGRRKKCKACDAELRELANRKKSWA